MFGRNEFLATQNPTLDTKIVVLVGLVIEIWDPLGRGSHFGSHLEFAMTHSFENIFVGRNEFLAPQNPTLDTKIIVLGGLVIEIWDPLGISSHHGGHLEFLRY